MTNSEPVIWNLEQFLQPIAALLSAGIIAISLLVSTNLFTGTVLGASTTNQKATPNISVSIDDDAILGNKDTATMAIVEFSDYECPFCKRHFTETHAQLKKEYIDTGKAILIFRDFPLSIHDPLATTEALAAECIHHIGDNDKYYAYHDLLFSNTTSNGTGLEKSKLYDFARQVGVDADQFGVCLENEQYKAEVQSDIAAGQAAGVSGTPAFIVGKYDKSTGNVSGDIISGAVPFDTFKTAFEKYGR